MAALAQWRSGHLLVFDAADDRPAVPGGAVATVCPTVRPAAYHDFQFRTRAESERVLAGLCVWFGAPPGARHAECGAPAAEVCAAVREVAAALGAPVLGAVRYTPGLQVLGPPAALSAGEAAAVLERRDGRPRV